MNADLTPLPWKMSEDGAQWSAVLADGTAAIVERLDDGVTFLPRVGSAVGPACDGLLAAANWASEYAGAQKWAPAESDEELPPLEERVEFLADRVAEISVDMVRADSIRQIADIFWKDGFQHGQEKMLHRLDALDVRVEELEAARRAASV